MMKLALPRSKARSDRNDVAGELQWQEKYSEPPHPASPSFWHSHLVSYQEPPRFKISINAQNIVTPLAGATARPGSE
jgi:hypothetical protein